MVSKTVTVIIPTTAQILRFDALKKCVQSIRDSSAGPVQIIAVVNGMRFDHGVCDWLRSQPDVYFHYSEKPSAPNAICEGRELVATEFFSTLDDDDEYLPGGTDLKVAVLINNTADFVITNSFVSVGDSDKAIYNQLSEVPTRPLALLFARNWLNSGNALYRTSAIGIEYFANSHPFAEWTWLAFNLAMDGKVVAALDQATNRINVTPGSLSVSKAYLDAYIPLFNRMLKRTPPQAIRKLINRKLSAAWHDASSREMIDGNWFIAMRAHLRSLVLTGGARYLSFTIRLFATPLFRRVCAARMASME